MSTSIDIADAVVASLNLGTFSQSFTANRLYRPVFELKDLKTLTVSVVPKALSADSASRTEDAFTVDVDIAVQKKVDQLAASELDGLMDLVEEIVDHLRHGTLADKPDARWTGIANDPIFAPEHLEQQRVFTSILTLTYRIWR